MADRVRSARGRSVSSQRWLGRQLNDPYVAAAKRQGYRSRAAFKLIEIDDRVGLLRPGRAVVDLGSAPGGWTQVAAARVRAGERGRVVALDMAEMAPVAGAVVLRADFLSEPAPALVRAALGGPADTVLSDMAPGASGHPELDHLRIMALAEAALAFAREVLRPGGGFVTKVLQGAGESALVEAARADFATVRRIKPPASRADSAELYLVATGFRGQPASP